jgi:predicted mannosyl-3-phosphoglycerate phosphatase (HAD superfamily)
LDEKVKKIKKMRYNSKEEERKMRPITVSEIEKQLEKLPQEKLAEVYDFINFLLEKANKEEINKISTSYETMLASEDVLRRDWEKEEEEQAWANL